MIMRVQTFIFVLLMVLATPLFAAFPGNCLEFDGVDDNLDGDNFPTNLSQISMEAWIYHESLTSAIQRYITIGSEVAVIRSNGDDILHFYIKQSDGTLFGVEEHVLIADEWIHVAGTYDGSTLKLYINGSEVGSQVAPVGGIYAPNGDIGISSSDETMYGKMDEIRIWNDARTPAEIRENRFIELNGSESGLVSYWKLDESSGATAYDSAGNVDCTLNNMTNDDWGASGVPLVTVFSGIISSNTIWDEHMLITGDVTINDGATLTIEPGVQVYFDGNYQIDVQGTILAEGTTSDAITFTAHPTVPWNGIVFTNTPAVNDSSRFVYCTLENGTASSNGGAFSITNFDKILLENCTFQNNQANNGGAVFLNNASVVIKKCSFLDNSAQSGGAIYILNESAPLISRCIFTDNTATSFGGAIIIHHSESPYTSRQTLEVVF
jgi:parallel beta-helix repeat protein